MNRRSLRLLVLGFTCLWFGMLVPVHQRGQIQLPGSATAAAAADAGHCKRTDPDAPCRKNGPAAPGEESKPPGNCAVCHFILGLHAPPPVIAGVAPLRFLLSVAPDQPTFAPLRHAALPFHGLDPPLA